MTFPAIWAAVRASKAAQYAAMAGGAVLALLTLLWRARRQGASEARQEMETDALKDTNERLAKGRDAVRDGRDAGSPADRLRKNEGRWE